jgi:aryl-alcohol dehydrogenase-like predicted oxidoreductase
MDRNPLALGCWALGGRNWGGQSEKAAFEVMDAALENGICHFDTARAYGVSEKLIGRFLKDKREEIFLASKVYTTGGADRVREMLYRSLDALQTDFIDLYYLHWPIEGKDHKEQLEALFEAREQGLIGAVGLCNFSVSQLQELSCLGKVDFVQAGYHLLWRVVESELLPYCRDNGIGFVSYSSLGQGILTGKFPKDPRFPKGDHRADHVVHFRQEVWPHVYKAVEELKRMAEAAGQPLGHLALRWLAAQAGVGSVLVGARDKNQVYENAGALTGDVDDNILQRMTEVSDCLLPKLPVAGNIFGKQ